jgi:DNA-binding transcriptional LysR family regulator
MQKLSETIRSANALLVFETAARCRSFTRAADELHVTQAAVSRMVARLEDSLGLRLFLRSRGGLVLTEDGVVLQQAVSAGFGGIAAAIRELKRRSSDSGTVTMSLSGAFVSHWLMPRYERFQRAFPAINLRFQLISGTLHGPLNEVDLGLRRYDPATHHQSWTFCPEIILPVCSPGYLEREGTMDAGNLDRHTLIHLSQTTLDWADFAAQAGWRGTAHGTLGFSDFALVLQTAMLGQGVALGWMAAVSHPLQTDQLVPASSYVLETGREYRLIAAPGTVRPAVARVAEWMQAEMLADLDAVRACYPALSFG